MRTLDLVMAALADYRLSVLVSKDQITEPLRAAIGQKASEGGLWKFAADLVTCPYCLGVWFAAFIYLLSRYHLGRVLIDIFAIAGLQDYLQSNLERMNKYAEA